MRTCIGVFVVCLVQPLKDTFAADVMHKIGHVCS